MKHTFIKLLSLLSLATAMQSCAATKAAHHPQHVQVTETHTKVKTKVPACRRVVPAQSVIIPADSQYHEANEVHVLSIPAKVVRADAKVTHVAAPLVSPVARTAPAYKIEVPVEQPAHYEINVPQAPAPEYTITLPQGAHPKLKVLREASPVLSNQDVKVLNKEVH